MPFSDNHYYNPEECLYIHHEGKLTTDDIILYELNLWYDIAIGVSFLFYFHEIASIANKEILLR